MPRLRIRAVTASNEIVNVAKGIEPVYIRQVEAGDSGERIRFKIPYAPVTVEYSDFALEYEIVRRPGRKPILHSTNKNLRKVRMNILLANKKTSGRISIEPLLDDLKQIAMDDVKVRATYGVTTLPYQCRLTNLSITSIHRDRAGNITQAEAQLELTEAPALIQNVIDLEVIEYEPEIEDSEAGEPAPDPPQGAHLPDPVIPCDADVGGDDCVPPEG